MSTAHLAERFFDAVERGDIDTVRSIYAPHAVIWHNYDDVETSREENLAVLADFVARTTSRSYEQRRLTEFDGGFVQQHELRIGGTGGAVRVVHAAIICRVVDEQIVRLDEYFDPAQVISSSV